MARPDEAYSSTSNVIGVRGAGRNGLCSGVLVNGKKEGTVIEKSRDAADALRRAHTSATNAESRLSDCHDECTPNGEIAKAKATAKKLQEEIRDARRAMGDPEITGDSPD